MSDTAVLARKPSPRSGIGPALRQGVTPAIRIPVTPANRSRLRELRERELKPWISSGLADAPSSAGYLPTPRPDREANLILAVLAAAGLATLIQTTSVITAFVNQWESFRETVAALLQR